jgi:hypothetical protein
MRYLLGVLAAVLLPAIASAQDSKQAPLADYAAFCLALWDGASDVATKAAALELRDATGGTSGVSITIEKSILQFFKSGHGTVAAIDTAMEDGKESSCDINLQVASERTDLETMARTLDLDGQILTLGRATMGHWKIRKRQPAVLLRTILGKNVTTIMLVRYEPGRPAGKRAVAARRAR